MTVECAFSEKTIMDLLNLRKKNINLSPGFQRNSVWNLSDRKKLIQSIFMKYPIPSIFLYKRHQNGKIIYDVIDGKQRLETIFYFMKVHGNKNDYFDVDIDFGDGKNKCSWDDVKKQYKSFQADFMGYKIQTVEVSGEFSEIVDLFVRINSTGKSLTSAEKRKAKYYTSLLLVEADKLAQKNMNYFLEQHILSTDQLGRMKGTEIISELLISIHKGDFINKKIALDTALANDKFNGNTMKKLSREFTATMTSLKKVFPDLRKTRFHKISDFYTLFMAVWEMRVNKFVLTNPKVNLLANKLLVELSNGVDKYKEDFRVGNQLIKANMLFTEYHRTVSGSTDSASNRKARARIIKGLLFPLFEEKDSKRIFSIEQRRLLWNRESEPKCKICGKKLKWDSFTIDHVLAHVNGGRTSLDNAALLCQSCNCKKGAR